MTLKSTLNVARGLSRMTDGSFVFAGSSKKALSHNFE